MLILFQHMLFATINLTDEEQSYIANRGPVRAVSVDGSGPIQYTDAQGRIRGIAVQILQEIGKRTGLSFDSLLYKEIGDIQTAYSDGTDILFGIPDQYIRPEYTVSKPLLHSQTILYANKNIEPHNLKNKRFAATVSSALPEGITEGQAIYYQSREEAIKAVDKGEADFGYGNAYSVAFYTLQHGFRNIYTVPQGKEERLYRILFIQDDPLLISIIDKALASFSAQELQNITLEATSQVERIITAGQIMDSYGGEITLISLIVITILGTSLLITQRSRSTLDLERKKFRTIAEVSNEYLFEYDAHQKNLVFYEKFLSLFPTSASLLAAQNELMTPLATLPLPSVAPVIELQMPSGRSGFFRMSASRVTEQKNRDSTWIGKLQDISEEVIIQNQLKDLAQTDGLTGLLNAATTRLKIESRLKNKDSSETDYCILFDIDDFKLVNDTRGHLEGDRVLKSLGSVLLQGAHSNEIIIGRVGGDEFCIYHKAIAAEMDPLSYATALLEAVRLTFHEDGITISMGLSAVKPMDSYETLYARVDNAMYQAKSKGKNCVHVFPSPTME